MVDVADGRGPSFRRGDGRQNNVLGRDDTDLGAVLARDRRSDGIGDSMRSVAVLDRGVLCPQ